MADPEELTGDVDCIRPSREPDASWADDPKIIAAALETAKADPELAKLLDL